MKTHKMTLAEMLEVLEHVDMVWYGLTKITRHEDVDCVLHGQNEMFTLLPPDTIVTVQFKDYDLQISKLMQKQFELDMWTMNRAKGDKNE